MKNGMAGRISKNKKQLIEKNFKFIFQKDIAIIKKMNTQKEL